MKHTQQSGAKVYNPFTLSLYDWWVLNISNKYAWKCPTDTRLLPFFLHHMGETHLDIGVGKSFCASHCPTVFTASNVSAESAGNGVVFIIPPFCSELVPDLFERRRRLAF